MQFVSLKQSMSNKVPLKQLTEKSSKDLRQGCLPRHQIQTKQGLYKNEDKLRPKYPIIYSKQVFCLSIYLSSIIYLNYSFIHSVVTSQQPTLALHFYRTVLKK